ncbi:uncharacterized protein EI90DRAFT_3064967, partial [Cantharellus anzutake]|uniref:uncharacterized protein n=1 Tax=Cantharellus anzutake TaxID=1750568 RepID=UPI001907C02C
ADRIALARARAQNLKDMFERELLRQANAAEAARTPAAKTTSERKGQLLSRKASPPTSHAGEQQNTKTSSGTRNTPAKSEPVAVEAPAKPSKNKKKKKKGAALANASNPHHSRNYIPSRLPNSVPKSSAAVTQAGQNPISPLPIHFLSADLPRDEKNGRMVPISKAPIVKASDEWICLFCEYDLFYGWEASFRDAVKNRKKILRRRRRAREKAAMITTGFGRANSLAPSNYVEDETDEGEEYDEDEGERGQDLE